MPTVPQRDYPEYEGPSDTHLQMAQAAVASAYPTSEEAEFARKSGFGYGKEMEPFLQNEVARVLGQEVPGEVLPMPRARGKGDQGKFQTKEFIPTTIGSISDSMESSLVKLKDLTPEVRTKVADHIMKAAIVVNKMPIAAVGFDPDKVHLDVIRDNATIAGSYSPKRDLVYSNFSSPANLVHESLHRGLDILKKNNKEAAELMKGLASDETIVRYMMMKSPHGDLEPTDPSWDAAIEQRGLAKATFGGITGEGRLKKLERLSAIAAEFLKAKRPGGPR